MTRVGQRNNVLDGGRGPRQEGAILGVVRPVKSIVKQEFAAIGKRVSPAKIEWTDRGAVLTPDSCGSKEQCVKWELRSDESIRIRVARGDNCLSVCQSVCFSVSGISQLKPHLQTSQNFMHMLTVAVARFSYDDTAICHVLPVLWMTSCFW